MVSEAVQKKFQKLVRALGQLIRAAADESLAAKKYNPKEKPPAEAVPWTSAFLEARWFADAEGYTAKLRVVLTGGSLHSVRTTNDMDDRLDKLSKVRKEDSSTQWYGLKVTVGFDGEITTEFNNDPNCVVDPTWFYS